MPMYHWINLSVSMDGAPEMMWGESRPYWILKSDPKFPEFLPVHCIIHHEHLTGRYSKLTISKPIFITFFCTSSAQIGRPNQEFKNFIEELALEDKPIHVSFYCIVRWLSTSNVLNRFMELLEPVSAFLEEKSYSQLKDAQWMQDLMFFIDIMQHLQTLDLALHGKDKIISDLTQTVFSFQNKLKLLQRDIVSRDFNHVPYLKSRVNTFPEIEEDHKLEEYRGKLQGLLDDFQARFKDMQKLRSCFAFFVNPFMFAVINNGCLIHRN
nr:EPM2A-interacting protein 1-like [Chelonoidis abingdonii]